MWHGAGNALKARSGWDDCDGHSGNGTDDYGFSALPGGYGFRPPHKTKFNADYVASYVGAFNYAGEFGYWWTADTYCARERDSSYAGFIRIMYNNNGNAVKAYLSNWYSDDAISVRCVADAALSPTPRPRRRQ